jgi:outer membrane protein assembly factor BamA
MRFLAFIATVFIALGVPPAMAQCDDQSSRQFVIVNVNLERAGHLSSAQQASVKLRVIGRCFDPSNISELMHQVSDAYQSFGYFRATVSDPAIQIVDQTRSPEPVSLTFDVDEGQQFTVRDVIWHGTDFGSEQEWQLTSLHPGDVLDTSKVRDTVERVRRLYVADGFAEAAIVPQVEAWDSSQVLVHFYVKNVKPADRSHVH